MSEQVVSTQKELLGHPKGLFILFSTEMWERFSFYGIRAIMVLYMVDCVANGGFGWSDSKALAVLGFFQMCVYLTAIPGGFISDRWLGPRKSVWFGCLFIMLGNFALAMPQVWAFYSGLTMIALGGGLLKPNISTILGRLYKPGDPRQESAFSIFYLGINVGAFASGLVVGALAMHYGWRYGFLASAFGMLFGQAIYIWGQRFLRGADVGTVQKTKETTRQPLTADEKKRIGIILFSFVSVIVFFAAFEQSGGLLNLYAERFTDRTIGSFTIPTPWFQSMNPLYIILLSPLAAMLWPWLAKRGKNPPAIVKMGIGTVILGLGYLFMVAAVLQRDASATHQSSMIWVALVYLSCTVGELALSPVALSFITATAPQRMTSLVMGVYLAVTGVAGYLASRIGSFAEGHGEMKVFLGLVIITTALGLVQLVLYRKLSGNNNN